MGRINPKKARVPNPEVLAVRLLEDAMAGDQTLFTHQEAVESAWAVVEPVLKSHHPIHLYERGSWGPKEADALIAADGCYWHNPVSEPTNAIHIRHTPVR